MEPSRFGFNIATSIRRMKLEDLEAPESKREKKKQKCLEDDNMQEIAGTSLFTKSKYGRHWKKPHWKKPNLEANEATKVQHTSQIHAKVSGPWTWANRILPSQMRSTQLLPSLPTHFINIDERVSKVLLQLESNQFLGIVGVGGSGKTTLTKAVLYRVYQGFEATSFVPNMKDSKVVLDIQKQLLKDLKCKKFITNTDEASKCLQDIFEKKKVFVVFDDVPSQQQLHAIVSPTWVLANGSKMIATSRNWQNLEATCVSHNKKMEMELFDKDQAKELFYKHAFFQKQPPGVQFEEVANKVIEACSGLPLSLEVLGNHLCGVQQVWIWEHALQRLRMGQCLGGSWDNERIWTSLKISYDNLNEKEKSMFLDIACFFCRDVLKEGMQEEKALTIWNDDDADMDLALLNLMDRGLVRIDSDGMLTMHDLLRDMGRMIACKEHIGGQRIWNLDYELEPTPQNACMNIPNVGGLHIDGSHCKYNTINTFMNLADVRLLNIDNCEEVHSLYKTMKDARRLRWMRISILEDNRDQGIEELQPSFFIPFKQLRVLEMKGFVHLRHLPHEIGSLSMLEYMTISNSQILKDVPDTLGNLTSLVKLNLSYCDALENLPETLGNLMSLVTLDLNHCKNLKELPETLGNLTSLVTLNLHQCKNLKKLPETLGNLTSLVTLNLYQCKNLKKLPETLGNLTSLVTLSLSYCENLEEVPETLGNLTSLVTLNLYQCKNLKKLPETLGNLTSLVTLNLYQCKNLKKLPETLGNLTSLVTLNLYQCKNLKKLPETLGNLTSLVTLNLSYCENLEEVPETLGNLTSLVTLNLYQCKNLKKLLETLGNLTSLVTLSLSYCENLEEVPETLGNLTSLVTLNLYQCKNLKKLPETLGNLTSLVTLNLYQCKNLKKLPETLGNLTSLVTLNLSYCENLEEVPETLGNLTSLVTLNLNDCKNLKKLPETLGNLTSLVTLSLSYCENLEEVPETLGNLTSLVTLNLYQCKNLKKLPETLGNLTSLVTLNLYQCKNLKKLPETLGNLTSLVTLNLSYCENLEEVPETLGNLTSLVTLNLNDCKNLKKLPETLGNLTSLVTLSLSYCENLEEVPETLGNLTSLVTLNLYQCKNLKKLPETLGNLTSLVTLNLSYCENLEEVPETLGNLTSLATLASSYCENMKGKGLQRLVAVESDLTAGQDSQSGTDYEEALSCVTIEEEKLLARKQKLPLVQKNNLLLMEHVGLPLQAILHRADQDQKIFCHILGQLEDAIDQSQAQNNSPFIPYDQKDDREEDTSALEGPKSQEPFNLQQIVCSKGDGVALNMQNLKSNLEDHCSFATTVVGEMVDDSLRLCFENGETMSRMVGVGLDYAVVMVNCDYEIVVEEKSEDMWRSYVSGNETTMIERLMVRISNHIDNLEGNSSQSLDPIRMAKLLGVGIEGLGKYTNREKKPFVSWNPIIELVKIMFWNRFQRHTMFAINAKSNDAKVQSRVHGAKIWDLEGENEDGLNDFKVPPNWWSTKWWQNIVVDDIQPNTPISLNKESSSGKIGHQQSGDDNVQCGKDPSGESSSLDEDSKLHHQPFDKINSHGKRKNKHGGDNNDEDDDHNNAKRTCEDGSKVELYMDEEDDIMSTVCVSVKPKYGCWKPLDADLDKEPTNITPHLKFWFHKSTSSREIKVNTSVRFDLGDHGPTLTSGRTFFGWFHNDIEVSLRSMERDSSTLKHDNKILQPSTSGKTSWRETSGSTSNPAHISAHLPVLNRPFKMGGMLSWEKGRSATHTREVEQICEMVNQQSWGGFIFKENCSGGGRPRLAYNLKHPIPIPNQVWEKSCYDVLLQCGICSTITPAIEGTWEDLNESEASPYLLEAQRVFQKRCRNKMISTGGHASNETHDDIIVEEQKYHVKLYVNHAMTHMNQFHKLTLAQNKTMEGGLINLQDDFYGKVEHGRLRQEQLA